MSDKLRFDALSTAKPTPFRLEPSPDTQKAIAKALDLLGLRKLRFEGEIRPMGQSDWHLTAHLGATVVQPCGVTLEPVTTRIEDPVSRIYVADWTDPEEAELEIPEDDDSEPIPETLDLLGLAQEALALALPAYPRLPDAELSQIDFAEDGVDALTDETAKPFAGLSALKQKLENGE